MGRGTVWFLGAEAALYAGFLALDLAGTGGGWSLALKYSGIALCLLSALLRAGDREGRLVCAALALTLSADFFLLVLDAWYALGVALFCGVQGLYLARLRAMGAGLWLPLRLGLTAAALLAAALLGLLTPLNALALVYFPELVCNAAAALSLGRRGRMFGLGLLLFVGCDVCVGLHNLACLPPLPRWACGCFTCPPRCSSSYPSQRSDTHASLKACVRPAVPGAGPAGAQLLHLRAHPVPPLLLCPD